MRSTSIAIDAQWTRGALVTATAFTAAIAIAITLAIALLILTVCPAQAQQDQASVEEVADPHAGHDHGADPHGAGLPPTGEHHFVALSDPAREAAARLTVQDWRGRMKPLDTLAHEMVMKVTKKTTFEGHEAIDLYLNWIADPEFWWTYPVIAVRYGGLKDLLGVPSSTSHVSAASLFDEQGRYAWSGAAEEAHRTPDRERTKVQRKLISFDERFNLFYMSLRGQTLRIYPVPEDPNNTWLDVQAIGEHLDPEQGREYQAAFAGLFEGLRSGDNGQIMGGIEQTGALQQKYGAAVVNTGTALAAELWLNRAQPFVWVSLPYLAAFALLMFAFNWNLLRRGGRKYPLTHPLYALGMLIFVGSTAYHLFAYVLRWIASGRAPLSNGFESLIFIALTTAIAGLIFELRSREGVAAGLSALLTSVILGTSMLSTFDPAIGPLVPVLASYWLNIHVTIITASYAFLGLSAAIGAQTLGLYLAKGPGREALRSAIGRLDRLNYNVMVTGLGMLTVGTLLGGVWANESWGRYWGWDSKETWSLVTILVYAVLVHLRFIPVLRTAWVQAAGSFAAISSVVMTYFGVNYFLSGLHSYASGDVATVPSWVHIGTLIILTLIVASYMTNRYRRWETAV